MKKLKIGQIVRVQNQVSKTWERKAKVLQMCEFRRSYELQGLGNEVEFCRNRTFLKPVSEEDVDESANEAVNRPKPTGPSESTGNQNQQLQRSARLIEKHKINEEVS